MNKLSLTIFVTVLLTISAFAQGQAEKEEFKPSGKPFATVFTNIHSATQSGKTNYAFELNRAYLGYGYKFNENFSGKLNIDVGSPEINIGDSLYGSTNLDYTAYIKIAALSYKIEKLSVDFGLIGLKQFKEMEKVWGRRYIYKAFQDAAKMGSSADLGLSVDYKILDQLSADITISNGEGYKNVQTDSVFKYSIGITEKPINGLTLRVYYDYMNKNEVQSTISGFAAYENKLFNVGFEYDIQQNNKNKNGNDLSGFTIFGKVKPKENMEAFVRYDNLSSAKDWNIKKDGQLIIAGIEYKAVKGIKIAPNYQGWIPSQSGAKSSSSFYINLEMKF